MRLRGAMQLGWACLVAVAACGGDGAAPSGAPYDTLDEWGLFQDAAAQIPATGVEPYEVTAPLFSDYADKLRFMYLPEGATADVRDNGTLAFPVGAILVKTFAYPDGAGGRQLIETRLLVREADGFVGHTYVWNEQGTVAERKVAGAARNVSFVDASGTSRDFRYFVPTTNECHDCHGETLDTLGGVVRQLDRPSPVSGENQLARLVSLGWLSEVPAEGPRLIDPAADGPLEERARSYLDANCGSCHREGDAASQSGFWLSYEYTDPASEPAVNWGVCKTPTSAGGATCGLTFDIVPGRPEESIFVCRMRTEDPESRMPPLGRQLAHEEGIALVEAWISAMPPADCSE